MTIEEALKIFENVRPQGNRIINEALNTIKTALEKQIPKTPLEKEVIGVSITGYKCKGQCPKCSATVSQFTGNYCPQCGQAIDWSENSQNDICEGKYIRN